MKVLAAWQVDRLSTPVRAGCLSHVPQAFLSVWSGNHGQLNEKKDQNSPLSSIETVDGSICPARMPAAAATCTNTQHRIKCESRRLLVAGHRLPVQRAQGGPTAAARPSGAQAGPLPGVRRRHADPAAVLLHAGRALAGLHLVLHR